MTKTIDTVTHNESHGSGIVIRPDGFTTVTLFGLKKTLSDFIEGIFPTDRRELTASFAPGAAQRLGQAVGMMLPHVVRFNAEGDEASGAYAELAAIGKLGQAETSDEAVESLAKRLTKLLEQADMPVTLRPSGVEESMLPTLAAEAAGQWTANFNPREVGQAEMESIYQAAF